VRPAKSPATAAVLLVLLLLGCAVRPDPVPVALSGPYAREVHQAKTVVPAGADLAVVWVNNGCSGVLVGRRSVLTAGHCPTPDGTEVVFAQDREKATFATAEVDLATRMPGWDGPGIPGSLGRTGVRDLTLLRLAAPVPASVVVDGSTVALEPLPIDDSATPVPCSACVRHVGFGRVVTGEDNYQKHSVVGDIRSVTAAKFEYGGRIDGIYRGSCHGDSGGAGFTVVDGVEKLIGIINNGDPQCASESWDIRTDRPEVQRFVVNTLTDWHDCTTSTCRTPSR
jgi:hypothetical protein